MLLAFIIDAVGNACNVTAAIAAAAAAVIAMLIFRRDADYYVLHAAAVPFLTQT